jgi:hypothetical protein
MKEDYPRTILELERRFTTEDQCRAYLSTLRWPDGFRCPKGQSTRAWKSKRGLWVCAVCERQSSVTAGTIFDQSNLPLTLWFRAIWQVVSQKDGASALGLQRVLGLGSYRTAWSLLHKLRRAMVRPESEPLGGVVEVDETHIGAGQPGPGGRTLGSKALVIAAVQLDGRRIGRIRLRRIKDATPAQLMGFICDWVAPGALVRTDGWRCYAGLPSRGYGHDVRVIGRQGADASKLLPHVHLVFSLLKRWLLSTHQGAVALPHLDYYLDEFTFRFNRRRSASRGKLFLRLLQNAVVISPHPYTKNLRGGKSPP